MKLVETILPYTVERLFKRGRSKGRGLQLVEVKFVTRVFLIRLGGSLQATVTPTCRTCPLL